MTKQTWTAAVSALLFVAFAAVVSLMPVPYVSWSAGTTVDLFEPVDGQPRVEVSGVTTYPPTGQLRLTTVSVTRADSQLTLPEALLSYWLAAREVLPREAIYPAGVTVDEIRAREVQSMDTSQSAAVAAALRAAGQRVVEYPMISAVANGGPSDGKLRPGDFILRIDGRTMSSSDAVRNAISEHTVGKPIAFTVLRERREVTESLVTAASNNNPSQPVVGINLAVGYSYEPTVNFRINPDIGGPSAGLMFALAVYDEVTPDDLVAGRSIAGTGTITGDGEVGAISGIQEKIAGAEAAGASIFLVPALNCPDVAGLSTSVRLVRVGKLSEAIGALNTLKDPSRATEVKGVLMKEPNAPLTAALMEIERHVASAGWDQPARLFALVPTADLLAAEPGLADQLGGAEPAPGQLSAIEQDDFTNGAELGEALAGLAWPSAVFGVALSLERYFLPGDADQEIPAGDAGAEQVRSHPGREEIRVVTGALRDGSAYGVARIRSHPDELLSGDDLVPGLSDALARTLD